MATETKRPNGVVAWMYRLWPKLPQRFQSKRMITLHHIGRKSGQARMTGLDRLSFDETSNRYFVAAAYGSASDWWLNVVAEPEVTIDIDGRRVAAHASPASDEESAEIMARFAEDRPKAFRYSCRRAGIDPDSPDAAQELAAANPLMSFRIANS